MGKVIVEVSVVPLGTGTPSLSSYVAEVEKRIRMTPGIKSLLTPMSTILEGDLEAVLRLVREIHEIPFQAGATRVSTRIAIDDRRDREATMAGKLAAIEKKLGE